MLGSLGAGPFEFAGADVSSTDVSPEGSVPPVAGASLGSLELGGRAPVTAGSDVRCDVSPSGGACVSSSKGSLEFEGSALGVSLGANEVELELLCVTVAPGAVVVAGDELSVVVALSLFFEPPVLDVEQAARRSGSTVAANTRA